ncbi:MAG: putative nicotinate-nucleotide pyrophosphorylase [carboxylating] [Nitrospirae bacterium]|nr:putative nicotinate-nucleotide pyrophosphorylase [carboxylating] [Nitrospirota bacterium]MCE7964517.1 carboxylating nicotinate-nucleotide diphosphorylase [Nitrospira sp. NTP2]MCK6492452.1 carboxylating nicotinate-nucleotide diphosphorylase [Nitrospira sp.]MEB2339715.1 carboxylating nicotinate-nucleotide diphosphorylase [Nitrospirales bacterium]QOJ34072.1 MAG: carboxylating nicotinate-nucleotide diphosphorylase [Nitrospira sp.]
MSVSEAVLSPPNIQAIHKAVQLALDEDLACGDVTTNALFPRALAARATIIAHQVMTVAGIAVAREVFLTVDPSLRITEPLADGTRVKAETAIMEVDGDVRSLLMAERVAVNFLQRLSGIATLTAQFCSAVGTSAARILDTRKTTPGLRALEKWAVALGGGKNHRFSLGDGILIKDNHLAALRSQGVDVAGACRLARAGAPHGLRIEVEAKTLEEVKEALAGKADIILLDNMSPALVRQAVDLIKGRTLVEVSGGITLDTVEAMAKAGADFISVGALTHSAPAANLSLDLSARRGRRGRRR